MTNLERVKVASMLAAPYTAPYRQQIASYIPPAARQVTKWSTGLTNYAGDLMKQHGGIKGHMGAYGLRHLNGRFKGHVQNFSNNATRALTGNAMMQGDPSGAARTGRFNPFRPTSYQERLNQGAKIRQGFQNFGKSAARGYKDVHKR